MKRMCSPWSLPFLAGIFLCAVEGVVALSWSNPGVAFSSTATSTVRSPQEPSGPASNSTSSTSQQSWDPLDIATRNIGAGDTPDEIFEDSETTDLFPSPLDENGRASECSCDCCFVQDHDSATLDIESVLNFPAGGKKGLLSKQRGPPSEGGKQPPFCDVLPASFRTQGGFQEGPATCGADDETTQCVDRAADVYHNALKKSDFTRVVDLNYFCVHECERNPDAKKRKEVTDQTTLVRGAKPKKLQLCRRKCHRPEGCERGPRGRRDKPADDDSEDAKDGSGDETDRGDGRELGYQGQNSEKSKPPAPKQEVEDVTVTCTL
eukprot:GSA25T00027150001.1